MGSSPPFEKEVNCVSILAFIHHCHRTWIWARASLLCSLIQVSHLPSWPEVVAVNQDLPSQGESKKLAPRFIAPAPRGSSYHGPWALTHISMVKPVLESSLVPTAPPPPLSCFEGRSCQYHPPPPVFPSSWEETSVPGPLVTGRHCWVWPGTCGLCAGSSDVLNFLF